MKIRPVKWKNNVEHVRNKVEVAFWGEANLQDQNIIVYQLEVLSLMKNNLRISDGESNLNERSVSEISVYEIPCSFLMHKLLIFVYKVTLILVSFIYCLAYLLYFHYN